jgi:GT2 family glycosyltransferase
MSCAEEIEDLKISHESREPAIAANDSELTAQRIAVVMTCHNRREKTLACLRALRSQASPNLDFQFSMPGANHTQNPTSNIQQPPSAIQNQASNIQHQKASIFIEVFLTDDGCTDGTGAAVKALWPGAHVIAGSGQLYWCGGMRVAWREAQKSNPDYFLLLNDDTLLLPDALARLLAVVGSPDSKRIGVGAVSDPKTGRWSYGGQQSGFVFDPEATEPRFCRTFNANCALVPREVHKKLGGFHWAFKHSMGDLDYGLQATKASIPVLEAPGFVGTCKANPIEGSWKDPSLPGWKRLRITMSPKVLPLFPWLVYCLRHGGIQAFRYFFSPYIKALFAKSIST